MSYIEKFRFLHDIDWGTPTISPTEFISTYEKKIVKGRLINKEKYPSFLSDAVMYFKKAFPNFYENADTTDEHIMPILESMWRFAEFYEPKTVVLLNAPYQIIRTPSTVTNLAALFNSQQVE